MKRFHKMYAYVGAAASGALAMAPRALAAYNFQLPISSDQSVDTGSNNLSDTIPVIATNVINIVLLIAGVLAVLFLILSGIQYITSAGNADKAKAARGGIIHAIIGIIIIMGAFFIVRLAASAGNTAVNGDNTSSFAPSVSSSTYA